MYFFNLASTGTQRLSISEKKIQYTAYALKNG